MKIGTGYPLISTGDLVQTRDFAQQLDSAGFDYLTLAGHVLGRPQDVYEGRPPATYVGPYYDPFVLFSYLAAHTNHIEFMTSILILPLFQTVVVAKQAAELSFVSGGRFGLGVGISWQEPEYEAMGQDVHTRGKRLEEQIEVMRLLWSQPYVTYKGRWHNLDNIGLGRVPAHKIPIWMGAGMDDARLRRIAKLGDGWMPLGDPTEAIPKLTSYLKEAGRDPSQFLLMSRVNAGPEGPDAWIAEAKRLQGLGITHITVGAPPDLAPAESFKRMTDARQAIADALN